MSSDNLGTRGGVEKWWKETGLADRARNFGSKEKEKAYNEFQLFFYRLVCLSSVRVVPDPFKTWNQIQGNNPHHMSAGYTKATPDAQTQHLNGKVDVNDVLNRSHDAFKVLFFNRDQKSLLCVDNLVHALFLCDFGAGKQ